MSDNVLQKNIPLDAEDIVVFVHGFGVRWDSRGMFKDIQESLPENWGSVLFDLYDVKGKNVYVASVDEQARHLRQVLSEVSASYPMATIHIIAHSKGCIITSLGNPDTQGNIILLSPPEKFGTDMQTYFERYPGAEKKDTEIVVPRKDGTVTHIPNTYFSEASKINAQELLLQLSKKCKFVIIQTTDDEVIGDTTYDRLLNNDRINIVALKSDHNFTGEHRKELIDTIKELLK